MGHQKATLTTGDVTIELSLFEEQADGLDTPYEEVNVTATLSLPSGSEYSCQKDLDGLQKGLLNSISSLLNQTDESYALLYEACTDVIDQAEQDTEAALSVDPNEVLSDFKRHTAPTL